MDDEQPSPSQRKVKFTPKAPSQRRPRRTVPKTEVNGVDNNEDEAVQAQKLMRKFNENFRRQGPRVEKKSTVQVAFGPGATSSTSIRTFGVSKGENPVSSGIKDSTDDDGKIVISSLSTDKEDEIINCASEDIDALPLKIKKDYREPWDYDRTYYPTTLPLRRPYSGDPVLLDEAEFGEAEYDESTMNPASDLELLEECDTEKMIFFQLPAKLPLVKRSASAKGKEKAEGSIPSQGKNAAKKESSLDGLSAGYMGKMLVYRSGAVKLKLGDTLYDVSQGSDCMFAQDVMAINTAAKHCCTIGELEKRAVVTPDVDSLLDSVVNLS
ncbi:DNA-directed RNA polymerase III subunit rpc4 [Ricinus communis]|uniref:DNA-directed RNA polymerase III subunit rpc4 n=1 Tax=Ricinus communis TaxID=3988 RepID=UPI00201A6476|nr:DNA-directed RNA polymerase III subunit rpc4 [Ricinus communis]